MEDASHGIYDMRYISFFINIMKKISVLLLFLCLHCVFYADAQLVYHNASDFPLLGKATDATTERYVRFPDSYKSVSREPLWYLSRNSAGMSVRFRSNSTQIALRWESLNNFHMDHMSDVGVRGLDLYCWDAKAKCWRFINSARPQLKKTEYLVVGRMEPEMREYMVNLSLYDGVSSLEIGVDSLSVIEQPQLDSPRREKPVVMYGTSILQGGCASRPGMAFTNILSRRLNREFINLGFSGNAFLDFEVAELMSGVDASAFVLDFVPNVTVEQMEERMDKFYHIIRDKHPDTPIIFVEDPIFTSTHYDIKGGESLSKLNETLLRKFKELKKTEKHIYYVSSKDFIGEDREGTVDAIHFTDLGMMRYSNVMYPILKRLIK